MIYLLVQSDVDVALNSIGLAFFLLAGLLLCYGPALIARNTPGMAEVISPGTRAEIKASLESTEIKTESPAEYSHNIDLEQKETLVALKKYRDRSSQRFTFFSASLQKNKATPLHKFIQEVGGSGPTLAVLSNSIFEFAEADLLPCPNRFKLQQLLELSATDVYDTQTDHNFFRQLATPVQSDYRATILDQEKIVNSILSYVI